MEPSAVSPVNRFESKIISDLRSQVQCLENEKEDLISSLEQLNVDNQDNIEKIIKYKDSLQLDLRKSKLDFEQLKQEYDKLKDWSGTADNETQDDDLVQRNEELEQEVLLLKENGESTKLEKEKLVEENRALQCQIQDQTISQADYQKLETILREYEKRLRDYETELQKLNSNSKNDDSDSLQNIVESSNKIIDSKNIAIKELEEQISELQNKLLDVEADKLDDQKIFDLELGIEKLNSENVSLKSQVEDCKLEVQSFESLKRVVEKLTADKQDVEKNFVQLEAEKLEQCKRLQSLTEHFQVFYNKLFDSAEDFKELTDFKSKSDAIINLISDLRSSFLKSQNDVSHLSDQNQKYLQEIEKLTRNSSTLKQEIVNKNIEFEEFEAEYNELLKSNDLMIAELNNLKSSSLVTISETNEENMLQLESDLESANSKIKQLEVILDSEKSSSEPLDYQELQRTLENYDELQKAFDKSKLDYENLDYKYNEQRAQIESLQEDLLSNEKQKIYLEEQNNVLCNKIQDVEDTYQTVSDEFIQHKSSSLQDVKNMREKLQNFKMAETSSKLHIDLQSKDILELQKNCNELQVALESEKAKNYEMRTHLSGVIETLAAQIQALQTCANPTEVLELEKQLDSLNSNREELIAALNSKHEESLNYYQDIQNLQKFLMIESDKSRRYEVQLQSNEDISNQLEKLTDQNEFLKEKCKKMTETLMHEQSASKKQLMDSSERDQGASKELERLRQHLLEIEEMYTKELLVAEHKTSEMQAKVNEIEQREKNSSNVYTSVSIRANQQVETLQTQLQLVTNQRDEIRNKLSDNEDQINKQAAALLNLQCVLQHFQKDKEKDVHNETDRIRRQINAEKNIQAEMEKEMGSLKHQLKESKEGLQAASRLTNQLEEANKNAFNMSNELTKVRGKLQEIEKKYDEANSQPDAKVDKMLIRNLIMGFVTSNNNLNKDQHQILKIIGTVLDFTQQDNDKLQMNKNLQQGSWMNSLLHPAHQNMSQESLSLAFVKFLENESKPLNLPSLLEKSNEKSAVAQSSAAKPSLLNEMVLPTFNDYGQRSASSILKDVLKDNH